MDEKLEKIAKLAFDLQTELLNYKDELKKETVMTEEKEWKPRINEKYYYIDLDSLDVFGSCWRNTFTDNHRLNHKVIFKTQQKAEEYLDFLEAKEKVQNEFSKEEWENNKLDKWYIYYSHTQEKFKITCSQTCETFDALHFRTDADAQNFINKYEKQMKYELGVC